MRLGWEENVQGMLAGKGPGQASNAAAGALKKGVAAGPANESVRCDSPPPARYVKCAQASSLVIAFLDARNISLSYQRNEHSTQHVNGLPPTQPFVYRKQKAAALREIGATGSLKIP